MAGFAIVECVTAGRSHSRLHFHHRSLARLSAASGIGAELLRRIEGSANAERATGIWLHVDPENTTAIRLYERIGYRKDSRADHYYARNRPAPSM